MSRDAFSFDPQRDRGADSHPSKGDRESSSADEALPPGVFLKDRNDEPQQEGPGAGRRRPEKEDSPRAYYLRYRTYFVRDSELATMAEIGAFRVVAADDLARFSYAGDASRADRDVRRLVRQGLLSEKVFGTARGKASRLLVLTKKGQQVLLKSSYLREGQAVYYGLLRPREAKHDAALYRLYEREAARIARAGGRPVRVALDYELQKNLHRDLAALGEDREDREARVRVAQKHGLVAIDGKIQVPDLRLEYETAEMEPRHADLELVTRNYRTRALAAKARAGFALYAPREDALKLQRVLDEAELTTRIVSL
jgi:hypothetical protein